jgi:hypothetical protein
MNQKISNTLIGIAGVHFVAYRLSLRGLLALPTIRNAQGYDIIVTTSNGLAHANIQVKTSQNRVTFWPMPESSRVQTGPSDFYVLLRWLAEEAAFEGFMLTGREARSSVRREELHQAERGRHSEKIFPSVYFRNERERTIDQWKSRWESWVLR